MAGNQKLNIVDEEGNIIGEETRKDIHKKGLLHREVHVWFYTSKSEIIFQHRSKNKDTWPDLLDATVGGHVEIGDSCESTAIKEMKEEAGISVEKEKLIFIQMQRKNGYDEITGMTNNVLRKVYAYCYNGKVEDLKIEKGESMGFEVWPLKKIFNISEEDKKYFIKGILIEGVSEIFPKIQKLIIS